MNFPDRIERVYMLYWGSVLTPNWKNMYVDDLLRYFKYELPQSMRLEQYINEVRFLNCNHRSQDYSNHHTLIDRMRPYKVRMCPLIVLNYNFGSYAYIIDSDYRFREFTRLFSETIECQVFGTRSR